MNARGDRGGSLSLPARASLEQGATSTEYGILAGFITLALIVGIQIFGSTLNDYYGTLAQWVTDTF